MKINTRLVKSPVIAGLFCCLLLAACQSDQPPETVTRLFWVAMANHELAVARKLASEHSRDLLDTAQRLEWKIDTLKVGEVRIDAAQARVDTQVDYAGPQPQKKAQTLRFDTFLVREHDTWKVDYRKTRDYMRLHPFSELLENLQNLGETFGEQLQKQMPLLEKSIESFGDRLNEQLKEFEREMEKAFPPKKPNNPPGSHNI